MRNGVIMVLLVLAILTGAGAGYLLGNRKIVTTTVTVSCPSATTEEYSGDFEVEVSYQGPWNANVSTYSAFATTPEYLIWTCHYAGSGTAYISIASPNHNREQTVFCAAHKLDPSGGNLTVTVTYGAGFRSNSTTLPFGSTMTFVSTAP